MPRTRLAGASAAVIVALLSGCGADPQPPAVTPTVWPPPADTSAAAAAAGLPLLNREMLAVHYHAHVDVIVRGLRVIVPANIGIDVPRRRITALHTHDTTGIVHIESAEDIPFTLGQFFTEWGQSLRATQVGPVVAADGEVIRVYRNGKLATGDPAKLRFVAHDQIVVWLGPSGEHPTVASTYKFPPGL